MGEGERGGEGPPAQTGRVIAFPHPLNQPFDPASRRTNPIPAGLSAPQKTKPVSFSPRPPPERGIPQRMSASKSKAVGPFRAGARPGKSVPRNTLLGTRPVVRPYPSIRSG